MSPRMVLDYLIKKEPKRPYFDICIRIVKYMSEKKPEELQMLTFQSFLQATGKKSLDEDVITAVSFLVRMKTPALIARLMYVDTDDVEYEIDLDDLQEARQSGVFIHPDTGIPIEDFETYLYPFFAASPQFLESE